MSFSTIRGSWELVTPLRFILNGVLSTNKCSSLLTNPWLHWYHHMPQSTNPNDLPIPGSLLLVEETAGQSDEILLHPTPSSDFNDPLNWSKWRKQLAFTMVMICKILRKPTLIPDTALWGMSACSVYSVLVPLSEVKGIPLAGLNAGTGYSESF